SVRCLASPLSPFTHPPTSVTYTLSLHDALPICALENPARRTTKTRIVLITHLCQRSRCCFAKDSTRATNEVVVPRSSSGYAGTRSEEHTSELQSRSDLVCRLLLEKKKKKVKKKQ